MKKILSLLLCALLMFTMLGLVSCDDEETAGSQSGDGDDAIETLGGKTPEQLYQAALDKVAGLTNYTMVAAQVISGGGMTINQTVSAKMDGIDVYVKTENNMDSSSNMECWYVDEMFYTIASGVKAKAAISYEKFTSEYMPEGATGEGALMNIPASWFVDTSFHQDGDLYYMEFIVSGEEYLQYFESTSLGAYVQGVDDISYKVYFDKDGNLGDVVTELDMVTEGVSFHVVSTSTFSNINSTTITLPANTDDFIDVTGSI